MKLFCIGDIAIAGNHVSEGLWSPPFVRVPGEETRVLFNWELPIGQNLNPVPRECGGPRILSGMTSPGVIHQWAPGFAALATNHILDGGEEGLDYTLRALQQEGFSTVGAGMTQHVIEKPLIWETEEGTLAIINWVFPEANPDWMHMPGANCWPGVGQASNLIRILKREVDWVMAFVHWSDEDFAYPRPEDRVIGRALAEAGTDIVVSHHPHVVRGMEVIGTCPVFYSLGNYYFSEYVDDSGSWKAKWAPRNREGLGIEISFKHGVKLEYKVISFWQANRSVINDPLRRAARRMKDTSKPLMRFSEKDYDRWYKTKRMWFDKIWIRWHFGIRRYGVGGLMRHKLHTSNHRFRVKG